MYFGKKEIRIDIDIPICVAKQKYTPQTNILHLNMLNSDILSISHYEYDLAKFHSNTFRSKTLFRQNVT